MMMDTGGGDSPTGALVQSEPDAALAGIRREFIGLDVQREFELRSRASPDHMDGHYQPIIVKTLASTVAAMEVKR